MSAYKTRTKDGYVVVWQEGHDVKPLKCFGDYQSAAIEFCNILNNRFWESKDSQIKLWKKSFDPSVKYSYPEFSRTGIKLTKQKI